jgi:hypothetical protein
MSSLRTHMFTQHMSDSPTAQSHISSKSILFVLLLHLSAKFGKLQAGSVF